MINQLEYSSFGSTYCLKYLVIENIDSLLES